METEVFQLDEGPKASSTPPRVRAEELAGSTPGTTTPPHHTENEDIAVERRVVPLLEFSEDTCSICLDEYTREDPGAPTVCGHHFHLQCIMQWAQRSRECPLCFRGLQLEDEGMNSLLPFGEYVSPAQRAAEQASLETWELERLLLRLAAASHREQRHHRSGRERHQSSSSGGGGGGSGGRHRRQGSRGEASAPQPIRVSSATSAEGAAAAAAAARWSLPGEAASSVSSSSAAAQAAAAGTPGMAAAVASAAGAPGSAGRETLRSASAPASARVGSWPPAGGAEPSSSGTAAADEGHVVSPRSRSGSFSLKGRLASLRLKDKLDKTARELKSLFSPGGGPAHSGGGSSSSSTHR